MSRAELADALNVAIDEVNTTGRSVDHLYVTEHWVGKLERGKTRWPHEERRTALRRVLGATTDAEIGLYSPRQTDVGVTDVLPWRSVGMAGVAHLPRIGSMPLPSGSPPVRPRAVPVGPAGLAAVDGYVGVEQAIMFAAWVCGEHAREAGAWAVDDEVLDQVRHDMRDVARAFDTLAPAAVVGRTLQVRNRAVDLLSHTQRPAQLNDLYLVAAQAVSLLASASIDLGLWSTAHQYAQAAEEYGEVIGHAGVRAYARGLRATIAYWTNQPEEAVRLAGEAVEHAPAGVARVRAASILARAWSHRGSVDAVRQALAVADDARSTKGSDELHDLVGGEFGYTVPQQARSASTAWLQVGQADEATAAAQRALDALAGVTLEPWSTVEAEARADLATCQVLAGDADAARETLVPLWSMPPDWRRVGLLGRVHRVQTLVSAGRWRPVPAAREIAEAAAVFAATAAVTPELPPA
ncbi:helix-turn-helix domain-containing protein [Dactylosporangium sp. CA-092794]|uniref:helix-turn-helix domain-containing protein n=1 Tax=Dactylosporangium sp. CA-092794 TaxID=3239929 RepID=UPI003D9050AD